MAWGERMVIAVQACMRGAATISGGELIHAINAVEKRMQHRYPAVCRAFFEPDVRGIRLALRGVGPISFTEFDYRRSECAS